MTLLVILVDFVRRLESYWLSNQGFHLENCATLMNIQFWLQHRNIIFRNNRPNLTSCSSKVAPDAGDLVCVHYEQFLDQIGSIYQYLSWKLMTDPNFRIGLHRPNSLDLSHNNSWYRLTECQIGIWQPWNSSRWPALQYVDSKWLIFLNKRCWHKWVFNTGTIPNLGGSSATFLI